MGNLIDTDGLDQYTDEITTFTSGDSSSPSSFTDIAVVASKEKPSSLFQKLSQAISNIRYLRNQLSGMDGIKITTNAATPVAASANANNSVAVGYGSNARQSDAIAVGYNAMANNYSIAIGSSAKSANYSYSVAVGANANAYGYNSIAIGKNMAATHNSIAIGYIGHAACNNAVTIGYNTSINSPAAIAIGMNVNVNCRDTSTYKPFGLAIGRNVSANCGIGQSIAIGQNVTANASQSIAIGVGFEGASSGRIIASNSASLAIGYTSMEASGTSSMCIWGIKATGSSAIAIGRASQATADDALAIGDCAYASNTDSIAIGYNANVSTTHTMQLGSQNYLSSLKCKVSLTVTSDIRDKTDIESIATAISFLNEIEPITYVNNLRSSYEYDYIEEIKNENDVLIERIDNNPYKEYGFTPYDKEEHAKGTKKGERRRSGVSAQNVREAMIKIYGTDNYANLINDDMYDRENVPPEVESHLGVQYERFVPFLIKAIQELDARVKELEGRK